MPNHVRSISLRERLTTDLIQAVKRHMVNNRMSVSVLAEKLRMTQHHTTKILTHEVLPNFATIEKLCRIVGIVPVVNWMPIDQAINERTTTAEVEQLISKKLHLPTTKDLRKSA